MDIESSCLEVALAYSFLEIYKGALLYTGQPFINHLRQTIIISQDQTHKWCEGRAKQLPIVSKSHAVWQVFKFKSEYKHHKTTKNFTITPIQAITQYLQ